MPIVARAGAEYTPAPAGTFAARCVDVVDLGMVEQTWGQKKRSQHKVKVVWLIDAARDDGSHFRVQKRYNCSLHPKATLRKDLESWRGKAFTDEELKGFDLEVLIGINCMVNVVHNVKDGSTYANVGAIMKLPRGYAAPEFGSDYVRECDREPSAQPDHYSEDPIDEDVPF